MGEKIRDILKVEGVKSKGFGIIPKLAMQDERLSIEAKAIYSYFCSFAGAGTTAFPGREKIILDLGISKSRYYKHFNLLVDCGYINVTQQKGSQGTFKRNIYTLIENPETKLKDNLAECVNFDSPCPQNKDTDESVENTHISPCTQNEDTGPKRFPCPSFPCTENRDTNNNSFKNNIVSQSIYTNKDNIESTQDGQTDNVNLEKLLLKTKEQLEIDLLKSELKDKQQLQLMDDMVLIITDMLMSDRVSINNSIKNKSMIQTALSKLTKDHLIFVIDKFIQASAKTQIKNKKSYLQSCIFNSAFEFTKTNHDNPPAETISNKTITKYYESQQEKNNQDLEQRKQKVYNEIPSMKDMDQQITTLSIQISKCALTQDKNIDQYKAQLKELQTKRIQLLLTNNFPKDYLDLKHHCSECQDTGVLGNGKRCDCYKKAIKN